MYNVKTSKLMFERSKKSLAGGVNSNGRAAQKPVPLFFERGQGSKVHDVDGNEYIDYVLGWGPLILGHNHPSVINAVKEQLDRGVLYSAQHELEIRLSEKLQQIISCADLVTYNNTGSEAVLVALKLARAYTGREKIVRFEGHYHGWSESIHVSSDFLSLEEAGPRESPLGVLTRGQPKSVLKDIIVLPWNDLPMLEAAIDEKGSEIAAVITEPIMQRGVILPRKGYLEGLRDICTRNDIVLIFDEVVTGFRFALGGAQEYFGVVPDLAVFSKGLGGGFPISCVAGKREIMDLVARYEVLHAGTFNGNPISMAAAYATILELEKDNGRVYERLFDRGRELAEGIREIGKRLNLSLLVQDFGPLFYVYFTDLDSVVDYRATLARDKETYSRFATALVERGILTLTSQGRWYLSAAHTEDDIEFTLQAVQEALRECIT